MTTVSFPVLTATLPEYFNRLILLVSNPLQSLQAAFYLSVKKVHSNCFFRHYRNEAISVGLIVEVFVAK